MRRAAEKLLIKLFDLFPKRLNGRVRYCLIVSLPGIVYKAIRRSLNRPASEPTAEFRKYYSEARRRFQVDEIPSDASNDQICVRFSGGTDSTLTAATMAPGFKKVHLLTFNTTHNVHLLGLISSNPSNAAVNANNLKRQFGEEKFVHRILNFGSLRNEIYFNDYLPHFPTRDFRRVSFCAACTLAMHIETIVYCLRNKIKYVSDGSNIGSGVLKWQMQNPYNMRETKSLYKMFDLDYLINPHYYLMHSDNELCRLGVIESTNVGKRYRYRRKTQQYCILIQFQSLCRKLHGRMGNSMASSFSDAGTLSNCFDDRIPHYREYIDSKIDNKNSW